MPELSIITSFYNCEKYLERYFKSILSQNYKDFELILINDGSTDDSNKIINLYRNKIDNLTYISKKNTGVSDSRNIGINNAKGEYLLFLDSDDTFEPNMLSKLMKDIDNNDLLIFGYNILSESGKKVNQTNYDIEKLNKYKLYDLILNTNLKINGFCWNKIIKKECIKKKFNKEISIMEDLLFWVGNVENIKTYKIINENLYNYYIHSNSALNSIGKVENDTSVMEASIIIINKIPENYKIFYEYYYCNAYYTILSRIDDEKKIDKYKNRCHLFYKEIMKSNKISKGDKIKIFIKKNFNWLLKFYFIYKKYIKYR